MPPKAGRPACWARVHFTAAVGGGTTAKCNHCADSLSHATGTRQKWHLARCEAAPQGIVRRADRENRRLRGEEVSDSDDDTAPVPATSQQEVQAQAVPQASQSQSQSQQSSSSQVASQSQAQPQPQPPSSQVAPQSQAQPQSSSSLPASQVPVPQNPAQNTKGKPKRRRNETLDTLNDEEYTTFEAELGRLFFAHAIPFTTVESPHLRQVIKRLRPTFDITKVPSRHQLAGRVLEAEYEKVTAPMKEALSKSTHVVVYMDEWKTNRGDKVFSLLGAGDGGQAHPVSSKPLEEECHNADELYNHLMGFPYLTKTAALVSDGASTVVAGCRRVADKVNTERPSAGQQCLHLVCAAHTLNRLLNDSLGVRKSGGKEVKNPFAWMTDLLSGVASSIRNVEALGRMFGAFQIQNGRVRSKMPPRPTLTRWTSSHTCWEVLFESKTSLILMNEKDGVAAQMPGLPTLLEKWDTFAVVYEAVSFITIAINLLQGNSARACMIIPFFVAIEAKIAACAAKLPRAEKKKMSDWAEQAAERRVAQYQSLDWLCAATVLSPVEYGLKGAGDAKAFYEGYQHSDDVIERAEEYVRGRGGITANLLLLSSRFGIYTNPDYWKIADAVPPEEWWAVLKGRRSCGGLSEIARPIVAIRPSTAEVERRFSSMGWISGGRRVNLNPQTIEKLSTVHAALRPPAEGNA